MSNWNDFNDADDQKVNRVIPDGAFVKVNMDIELGEYEDLEKGLRGPYPTINANKGSIYLKTTLIVESGEFKNYRFMHIIGLYSPTSDFFAHNGRVCIKAIRNSQFGLKRDDASEKAQKVRQIAHFGNLQDHPFAIKVKTKPNTYVTKDGGTITTEKNEIDYILTADDEEYKEVMMGMSVKTPMTTQQAQTSLYKKHEPTAMDKARAQVQKEAEVNPYGFDDEIPFGAA